jgi:preprotein translocase SecE subunit
MATAVETGSEPRTPSPPMSLPVASLLGSVYVVAAIAGVFYAVPTFWKDSISPLFGSFTFVNVAVRLLVQLTVAGGLLWFGRKLLGDNPPKGIRGGIFLMIAFATVIFLLWRWAALSMNGTPGLIVSSMIGAFLLYLAVRFFTGKTGERWMVGLEEQGWFHPSPYKRSLGQRVRRLTILGILLIGGSGVYSLMFQGILPDNWTLAMPFDLPSITVLTDAKYAVPLLLMGMTLWVAYRAVNVPAFAEFLIATEAEMNKVSWTSKRRLAQDTVVVLTTTLLLTMFLLVVDLFWGWLLSRETVGVLPGKATQPEKGAKAGQQAKW